MFNGTRIVLENMSCAVKKIDDININQSVSGYLTQYVLIAFSADLERELKIIICEILERNSTPFLSAFITNTLGSIISRTKKRELADTVGMFGNDKREKFLKIVDDEVFARYQNYLVNRDEAAHGKSINLTWADIQRIVEDGEKVMLAFREAIG